MERTAQCHCGSLRAIAVGQPRMGRWSERLARPFLSFADIAPGGRVLDVACGTGVFTKALAAVGADVIGIDASEGYLEGARPGGVVASGVHQFLGGMPAFNPWRKSKCHGVQ